MTENSLDGMLATMRAIVTPFDAKIEQWEGRLRKVVVARDTRAESEARSVLNKLTRLQYEWRVVRWTAGNGGRSSRSTTLPQERE